jgi:hypothetical protein
MGIVTVFEWDMFFPDLLDVFVLSTLPIQNRRLFMARVAAISIFILGFLFDANILAPLILPASIDPPNLARMLAGHLLAVAGSGLFAAAFILALQGIFLSVLGEGLFRRISLLLQGLLISSLLMVLFLFPVFSGAVPVFLKTESPYALYCPPFWFLGVYQRLMEGPSVLSIFTRLAQIGYTALIITVVMGMLSYPLAYLRRVRQLIVGPGTHDTRSWAALPVHSLLHVTFLKIPVSRAVFHFISQTLLRVPRYRIYLVMYGGVGLSVLIASVLRLIVAHGQVHVEVSPDGIRAAIAIVAFWTIAGLRMAFVSPGNRQGSWAFRIVHGRPPELETAMHQLRAAKLWVLLWAAITTFGTLLALRPFTPSELLTWPATASLFLIAAGMCLFITDLLFLYVRTVAFTGDPAREQPNLALTLLKSFTFLPIIVWIPVASEPWLETGNLHLVLGAAIIAFAHLGLELLHRRIIQEHCGMPGLEDDEEDFPMKLGLRY